MTVAPWLQHDLDAGPYVFPADGDPSKSGLFDSPLDLHCLFQDEFLDGQFETHEQSHLIYIGTDGQIVLEEPFQDDDIDARPSQPGANS